MIQREEIIKNYFNAWIRKDSTIITDIFDSDVIYSECYGPEYRGAQVIERWFKDWITKGTVLSWDIKQFLHQSNITAVEWYFKCDYEGVLTDFNGVSLIEFNEDYHIVNLKEFQSKIPHYCPYNEY